MFSSSVLWAQIYAPDTAFKFENATFELPAYKIQAIIAFNSKTMIARVERPLKNVIGKYTVESAVIDTAGNIKGSFLGTYIRNSLTEEGFWFVPYSNRSSDSTFSVNYFDLKTFGKISLDIKDHAVTKVENDRIITNGSVNTQYGYKVQTNVYNLQGNRQSLINTTFLSPKITTDNNGFSLQEIRVDPEKNVWVLVIKDNDNQADALQLYKLKPHEQLLTTNNLVFEKSTLQLGMSEEAFLWQQCTFHGDTILVKSTKEFGTLRELLKIDFKGNVLSFKATLSLINNDPNTNYIYLQSTATRYVTFKIEKKGFAFLDEQGKLSIIRISDVDEESIHVENNYLYYADKGLKTYRLDIKTLAITPINRKIPTDTFQEEITNIQSLTNSDFWVGYKDPYPYSNIQRFVKFRQGVEVYRFSESVNRIFYLGGNLVLLQTSNAEKVVIDGANNQNYLTGLSGQIVYVDTLRRHIYTSNNDKVNRYFFDGKADDAFLWEGGKLTTNIVVNDDGKIYHAGGRFEANGKRDKQFIEIILRQRFGMGMPIVHIKKVWNSLFLFDGECLEGCGGSVYRYDPSNDKYLKLDPTFTSFTHYYQKYESIAGRDSLLLVGFDKILPDLTKDSSFTVKGMFRTSFNQAFYTPTLNKYVDVLPNHDILAVLDNKIYLYSTKNTRWVEVRNLPSEIILSDSLKKNGITFETYSSDGSDVIVKVRAVKYSYSDGGVEPYSVDGIARVEGKKLVLGGQEGSITLTAQSANGGDLFYTDIRVGLPTLQSSIIRARPIDTTMYVDFKPFAFSYSVNINKALNVTTQGESAFIKDGVVYPTGKPGPFVVTISHEATSTHSANTQRLFWRVERYAQTITLEGLNANEIMYNVSTLSFPFKLPVHASSKLPLTFKGIDNNEITAKLFYISNDTVYLKPNYENILKEVGLNKVGIPITLVINATQQGNANYIPISTDFSLAFNYWIENIEEPTVSVFPNPFKDHLYITSDNYNVPEAYLFDVSGKELMKLKIENQVWLGKSATKKERIGNYFSIFSVPQGNYILVFFIDGKRYVQKITK